MSPRVLLMTPLVDAPLEYACLRVCQPAPSSDDVPTEKAAVGIRARPKASAPPFENLLSMSCPFPGLVMVGLKVEPSMDLVNSKSRLLKDCASCARSARAAS